MKTTAKILLLIIGLALLMLVTGCYTKHKAIAKFCPTFSKSTDTFYRDTGSTKIVKFRHDSIIREPADTMRIFIPSPCDQDGKLKPGSYSVGSGKNKTTVNLTDSGLHVQSNCAEQNQVYSRQNDSLIKENSRLLSIKSKEVTGYNQWPWYRWFGIGAGSVLLIMLLIKRLTSSPSKPFPRQR